MRSVLYSKKYNEILYSWLSARYLNTTVLSELPELGLLVLNGDEPIAAGFIRKVEGNHGIIDGYITNPREFPHDRDEALDLLTHELVKLAKTNNIKQLLALTTDYNTGARATKHGFGSCSHKVLIKKLI